MFRKLVVNLIGNEKVYNFRMLLSPFFDLKTCYLNHFSFYRYFLVTLLAACSGFVARSQVQFIENRGQWDPKVKFMSNAGDGSFFLEEKGYTVSQHSPEDMNKMKEVAHLLKDSVLRKIPSQVVHSHAYNVRFVNASTPEIIPGKPIPTINNYFIGNDPSKWASGCKIYQVVTYKNLYPGIDVRYFVDGGSNLKYDFIVHPGADVSNIAMKYEGADALDVKNRELVISTSLGKSRALKPYTYQLIGNEKVEVDCKYEVKDDVVKFKVKKYERDQTLIIDPTEIFFSYSGSTADNWGFTATYGADGSFYGGGIVFAQGFPVSPGSYNQTFNGEYDIGIIKLSSDGKNRIYATYIGGSGKDRPHSLIEDSQGNLIIAGRSNSTNYPEVPARNPTISGPGGGWDIIVTKLNATGSALIGSMRIGGSGQDGVNIEDESGHGTNSLKRNYSDDSRSEVIIDGANNIYVASSTSSKDFPITSGAVQKTLAGKQDAVVLKLNAACSNILASTYLGGTGDDAAYVLKIGSTGNIYVAGGTGSADLIGISKTGVIKPTFSAPGVTNDVCDGYVLEITNNASAIVRGTYIGTAKADQIYGIDLDKSGNIYIMGTSEGNMPVINAAYSNPGSKQFICKLEPDLSKFVYATIFGSQNALMPNISPTAFLVDRCENVYVSGWGGKLNSGYSSGNTIGMPVTPGAIKSKTDASGSDFYFFVLEKNAASQLYGSFFGQEDPIGNGPPQTFGDHVDGGTSRFDKRGYIYQAICANCQKSVSFPGTPGSWSTTNQATNPNSGQCNLGMLKIEMDFTGVRSGLQVVIDGVPNDTVGCVPLMVNFRDTVEKGKLYYWDFGDGTGDTTVAPNTSHLYTTVGTFRVRSIAIDSMACNISDTSYKNVRIGSNRVTPDFTFSKIPPCTNLSYDFTNTSTAVSGSFNPNIFTWDFGDNTTPQQHSFGDAVQHRFAGAGTYNVTLTVSDTSYCNSPADTIKLVRLSPEVKAAFQTPGRGCVPYNAVFQNNSLGGLNFVWDFGDGSTSTDDAPEHLYTQPGTYTVRLYAYDSTSCNKIDSTSFNVLVSPNPIASFIYDPTEPQENTYTNFTNQSLGAVSYVWNFGDGDTTAQASPRHIFPATGTYTVCLTAINEQGCADDTCIDVKSLITPLLDVPKAFTPGKFGPNSRIGIAGFGIKEMQWTIYNRWGQKVFESNNRKSLWDGTFNGKPQPMDVYTYTLKVTFSDGTKATKTGDITLIR